MKKFILSIIAVLAINFATAQTVTARQGTGANNDYTGRNYTYNTVTITPTSTMVTLPVQPYNEKLIVVGSVSLSPTFTANVTKSYLGDKLNIIVAPNATGTRTLTFSTNLIGTATTMTVAASKQAYLRFIFDGSKWMETNRTVQP